MIARSSFSALIVLVLLSAAISLPFFIQGNYLFGIAHQVFIFIVLASGYNVLLGLTGLVSFGHVALFAVGAYTSAILVKSVGLPFVLGIIS